MKTIKIILGIIIVVVVVFFATGLLVKETNYTAQVVVKKPIDDVFKTFNTIENRKQWIPEIQSVNSVTENFGKTGSEYTIIIKNNEQNVTISEKIIAYVPNEKLTLFYNAESMMKTNDYLFSEKNGVTTITLNATCRADSYLLACVFPYFKGTFKNQDQTYLTNFKAFIEQ